MIIMYPINNSLVQHLNLNNNTDRQFALCESCFWSATIFKSKVKNSIITLGVMSSMFLVNGKTGSRYSTNPIHFVYQRIVIKSS